jgi:hypothetical protein
VAFIINLDDDWLQIPGYIPKDLLRAMKAHEGIKPSMPTQDMLKRLVALTNQSL